MSRWLFAGVLFGAAVVLAWRRLPDPDPSYRPVLEEGPLSKRLNTRTRRGTMLGKLFKTRKRKTATLATLAVLVAAGAAFATWTLLGNGRGTAKVGAITTPIVTRCGDADAVADLYPTSLTGPTPYPGSACFQVENATQVAMTLTSATGNPASWAGADFLPAGCADLTPPRSRVNPAAQTALNIPIPAATTTKVVLAGVYGLGENVEQACIGARFAYDFSMTFVTAG